MNNKEFWKYVGFGALAGGLVYIILGPVMFLWTSYFLTHYPDALYQEKFTHIPYLVFVLVHAIALVVQFSIGPAVVLRLYTRKQDRINSS